MKFFVFPDLVRAFYFSVLLLFVLASKFVVDGSLLFRQENARIGKLLENDRPCNMLLDFGDIHLKTPGIVKKYGLPFEAHHVTTDDGYILELHRIPAPGQPVVFLLHGFAGSSRDFVVNCDRRALAFKLADTGYDVWMGNNRGNSYSTNHTIFTRDNPKFWNFSIDDVAHYDAPKTVDYILNTTGNSKLSWIGISMGNGVALAFLSSRPEYNEKVRVWFAMAAAAKLSSTISPFLRIGAPFPRVYQALMTLLFGGEFIPLGIARAFSRVGPYLCRREGLRDNYHGICAILYYLNDGYDPGQIPPKVYSLIVGELPNRTSVKYMTQWFSWIISNEFTYFDFGPVRNLRVYGTAKPKKYPTENLSTDLVLFWAQNDWITTAKDVEQSLPIIQHAKKGGKREIIKVASPSFNHADYAHGKDADILVYDLIIERLNKIHGKT